MQRHISGTFEEELESLKTDFVALGGTVEQQVANASRAFIQNDSELAESVRTMELQVNRRTVELNRLAEGTLALRQPAASDFRLIVGIFKTSTDLERIGDEADRIAKFVGQTWCYSVNREYHNIMTELMEQAVNAVRNALDAFTRLNVEQAKETIVRDGEIDRLYDEVVASSTSQIVENSANLKNDLAALWVARSLERIGDHAKNISETVIYLVEGEIVVHNIANAIEPDTDDE